MEGEIKLHIDYVARMNKELLLKHFKSIINDLTYAEWNMLKRRLDNVYENEKKDSIYKLKVDTSTYSNIKKIEDLY